MKMCMLFYGILCYIMFLFFSLLHSLEKKIWNVKPDFFSFCSLSELGWVTKLFCTHQVIHKLIFSTEISKAA